MWETLLRTASISSKRYAGLDVNAFAKYTSKTIRITWVKAKLILWRFLNRFSAFVFFCGGKFNWTGQTGEMKIKMCEKLKKIGGEDSDEKGRKKSVIYKG